MPISRRLPAAIFGFSIGAILITMGVPRLIAAYLSLPGDIAIFGLREDRTILPQELVEGATALDEANAWEMTGAREADRSVLLLVQAESLPRGDQARDAILAKAMAATEQSLALLPAQPVAWGNLAALKVEAGDMQGAVKAIRLSMLSGPVVPGYVPVRVKLGLHLLPYMDRETRGLLARQVRLLWLIEPASLVDLGKQADTQDFIRSALDGLSERDQEIFIQRLSPIQ